MIASSKFENLA
ncbi:hypothetical protein YPPY63_1030, partial [Yersinia pestis PY-63]